MNAEPLYIFERSDAPVSSFQPFENFWATNLRRDSSVGCVLRTIVDPARCPGIGA